MGDFRADMSEISAELKLTDVEWAAALRKQIRAAISDAGKDLADKVKSAASWSGRIPGAVSVKTSFAVNGAGASIDVNARKAPEAKPLESKSLRHPVFGNTKVWVSQPTRPFFNNTIAENQAAAEVKFDAALDEAVHEAGFK